MSNVSWHKPVPYLACLVVIALGVIWLVRRPHSVRPSATRQPSCMKVSGTCIDFVRANTEAERERGLAGRLVMDETEGMLFDFQAPVQACMWMKDMLLSIDMVWLNQDKKIIKLEEAVAPETYPHSYCADQTRYVVEVKSGVAKKAGLQLGQEVVF